jgi:uncharacterized protein (TIGR02453 family)
VATGKFTGFGEHAIDFYDGLGADNSKAFWTDNKPVYDNDVRAPMEALLVDLSGEFGEFGTSKVFRPHRDVRFAKDKSPYKTNCGAVVEPGRGAGAYYVEVSSDGLRIGGGCFHLSPDQIKRYRTAVDDERRGAALATLIMKLAKQGWEIRGEIMKTTPRGFAADHPRVELLRHKSIYAVRVFEPDDVLHERGTFDRVRTGWRQLRPFNEWAADHVGIREEAASVR